MPDGNQFDYDVFISYSSRDKAWVHGELLKRIEQVGLKAFIDFRDFTRGAPSIKEMERGVIKCRKTAAVLTPDYLKSGWAEIENIMLQTLDPANRELRLIPLLKKECEKPLRIGALTHIDFTDGADLELAWRQILTALGKPQEPEPPKQPEAPKVLEGLEAEDDWEAEAWGNKAEVSVVDQACCLVPSLDICQLSVEQAREPPHQVWSVD